MADLDRIVTFQRQETVVRQNPSTPPFTRAYQSITTQSADEGLDGGQIAIEVNGAGISDTELAVTATTIYLSISDSNDQDLPSEFPPDRLEIVQDGNGYRYNVTAADHPQSRDRRNRLITHTDTWRLTIDTSKTMTVGGGLPAFGAWTVIGTFELGEPVRVDGTVTHTLWTRRRDPRPSDQIAIIGTFTTIPISSSVWRFRADPGAVYPEHEDRFVDDQGEQWEVFGISESDERGRFVDLLASAVIGSSESA